MFLALLNLVAWTVVGFLCLAAVAVVLGSIGEALKAIVAPLDRFIYRLAAGRKGAEDQQVSVTPH